VCVMCVGGREESELERRELVSSFSSLLFLLYCLK